MDMGWVWTGLGTGVGMAIGGWQLLIAALERRDRRREIQQRTAGTGARVQESAAPEAGGVRVWSVPQRNALFTGRSDVLDDLHRQLALQVTAVLPRTMYGLGGVGKTQLAVEYAHRFAEDYDVVWWIAAEHVASARADLAQLGARLGVATSEGQDTVLAVLESLRTGRPSSRWLMIFDNADDPADLVDLIPQGPGHVLITSRNRSWERLGAAIAVDVFSREDSIALLTHQVPGLSGADAEQLAGTLGDLPLAIDQAGTWLRTNAMPVEHYLVLLDERLPQLLSTVMPGAYGRAAAATWLISLDKLRERSITAARLLELLALFGPEPVASSLLTGPGKSSALARVDPALKDPVILARELVAVGTCGLTTVNAEAGVLQIHRLVRAVIQDQIPPVTREELRRSALGILAAANPGTSEDSRTWPEFGRILPHALACDCASELDEDIRRLVTSITDYLWRIGDLEGSRRLGIDALSRWTAAFGENDPSSILLRTRIGNALRNLGDFSAAREYDNDAVFRSRASLGKSHHFTIMSITGLAADLRALGDFKESWELDSQAARLAPAAFGESHQWATNCVNNLAVSSRFLGQYQAAADLDYTNYLNRIDHLQETNPYVWESLASYGLDLCELGRYAEAQERLEEALEGLRKLFGHNFPPTVRTARILAATLRRGGAQSAGYDLVARTFPQATASFGADHYDTWACAMTFAVNASAVGKHPLAVQLATDAHHDFQEKFGDDHPFTLQAATNLAIIMRRNGDITHALKLSQTSWTRLRARLGEDHPDTLVASVAYSNSLYQAGERRACRAREEANVIKLKEWRGLDHPHTLSATGNLAVTLRAAGEKSAAVAYRDDSLARALKNLGSAHPLSKAIKGWKRSDFDIEIPSI